MKKRNTVWIFLTILVLFAGNVQAAVTIAPASITVAADRQSTHTITWNLTATSGPPISSSPQGLFQVPMFVGLMTIGTVNTTVTAPMNYLVPVNGTATETFVIPLSVLKKAEELGKTSIRYTRTFDGGVGAGSLNINLTSPSAAQLSVNSIRLYFENKRAETTVKRHEPGLKVYADIGFVGKGLFKGYWQVDDRIISYVSKNLTYGKKLTLETPDAPSLPTFLEGTHVVKFIIQNPEMDIEFPKALYYVTPGETTEISTIALLSPFELAVLGRNSPMFKWQSTKLLATYLLEFMETEQGDPVFSAYTTQSQYIIPDMVFKTYLTSPQPYYWRVTGLDKENNIAGESAVRQVRFMTE
jgi:hypothetical protein